MPKFLGKNLGSGVVPCSAPFCQFTSSLDERSLVGLFLSPRSAKWFTVWSFCGLWLMFSVEQFCMGVVFFWKTSEIVLPVLLHLATFCDTNLVYVHSYGSSCRIGPVFKFPVDRDEKSVRLLLRYWRDVLSTPIGDFFFPVQVLPILLWSVLHGRQMSRILPISSPFELLGYKKRSK